MVNNLKRIDFIESGPFKEIGWFVAPLVVNTIGMLEIIYLLIKKKMLVDTSQN